MVACERAAKGDLGAGDVTWARNTAAAEMAFVLEPDVRLSEALAMRVVLQAALIDALGVLMPSQTAIQIGWPDELHCNGAQVGGTVLVVPQAAVDKPDEVPAWMVLGGRIVISRDLRWN